MTTMTASTHLAPSPEHESEPSFTASLIVTLLPLLMLGVMFIGYLRLLRRSTARADEALRLSREMVAELRAIRAALEHPGATTGPAPSPPQRENTLSGQTLPSR